MRSSFDRLSTKWESVDFLQNPKGLPVVACCYVMYFDGDLKYIGSTNNLRNRFSGHAFRYGYGKNIITPWGDFDLPVDIKIKYKRSTKYGDWLMLESRLINRIKPPFNKRLKGRAA